MLLAFALTICHYCRYSVVPKTKKCLEDIDAFIKENHFDECGIIYCLSRMDCEKVSEKLQVQTYSLVLFFSYVSFVCVWVCVANLIGGFPLQVGHLYSELFTGIRYFNPFSCSQQCMFVSVLYYDSLGPLHSLNFFLEKI